jgi:uncharacterized protein
MASVGKRAGTIGCRKALKSFVEEPHAAIDGPGQGEIINLTDRRAAVSRKTQLDLLQSLGPDGIARKLREMEASTRSPQPQQGLLPHLVMPAHHDVRRSDVFERRLQATLAAAADRGPTDFSQLLLVEGVGPRTVQSLAIVAEVVHGAPFRFADPARFSFAHGGKDRHPFAVPLRVYDETLRVLKSAVQQAKLGREEELGAIKRLDDQARELERHASGPSSHKKSSARPPMTGAASLAGNAIRLGRESDTSTAVDEPHPEIVQCGTGPPPRRNDDRVLRSVRAGFLERYATPRCQPKLPGIPQCDRERAALFDS